MDEEYEPVHEVVDDYHGPRSGFADYRGAPHWFCALGWEARPEEGGAKPDNSGYEPKDDRFFLVPVTAPNGKSDLRDRDIPAPAGKAQLSGRFAALAGGSLAVVRLPRHLLTLRRNEPSPPRIFWV